MRYTFDLNASRSVRLGGKMTIRDKLLFLTALIATMAVGCCFHSNITRTAAVQQSGVLGLRFHTTQPLVLAKREQSRVWRLVKREHNAEAESSHPRIIETGTVLEINQVIKVTELCEWMVVPAYFTWDCTLARIESGPYAGKEIGVAGEGLSLDQETVTLGSSLLWPIDQASMIPALYKMHGFYPPPPAAYTFCDSKGNQFATVTLIHPTPFWGDKLDGMWFGTLSKSYVRPNSSHVLASDKLNVRELHPFTGCRDMKSDANTLNLNPDEPDDYIILSMPISEANGPVKGWWDYATDAGGVENGTFYGPVH